MLMRLSKNSSGCISFSRSTTVEEYHHIHLALAPVVTKKKNSIVFLDQEKQVKHKTKSAK